MDHIQSRESDLEIDLESGGTTSEEDGSNNQDLTEEASNKELYKAGSGFVEFNRHMNLQGSKMVQILIRSC